MTQSYLDAANDMKRDIAAKVATIKSSPEMVSVMAMLPLLNGMEALLNQPRTTLGALFALESTEGAATPTLALQPDEFVNLPALEAAKKYLRMAGKPARPFREIVKAIKDHGGEVGREDRLKIQLVRSTSDIKKVGEDRFGLTAWYPPRKGRPVGSQNRQVGDVLDDDVEDVELQPDAEADELEPETENAPPEGEALPE